MYERFCWKGSVFRLIIDEETEKKLDSGDLPCFVISKGFITTVFILEGKEKEILDSIECQMVYNFI